MLLLIDRWVVADVSEKCSTYILRTASKSKDGNVSSCDFDACLSVNTGQHSSSPDLLGENSNGCRMGRDVLTFGGY
jgi:hypothetical protein